MWRFTVVLGALVVSGCCSAGPTQSWPPTPSETAPIAVENSENAEQTPKVVRRLLNEAHDRSVKNLGMASELADPRGRVRAMEEAREIDFQLGILSEHVNSSADSDTLDAVMNRLHELDQRTDLLNERLRAATLRTTAVLKE